MLKHVQVSPMRNRADTVSLRSSANSTYAPSICGSPEPPTELQRTQSRASSYASLSLSDQLPQTTIKIYTGCLKIDIEYKTLGIQWDTTSKEIVSQLLRRLKLRHRDPRLFYLSMEVCMRRAGVKTILVLDDDTRPAILQACHPKGESRFVLQLKSGGMIRVHTAALQPHTQYKSLIISQETTSDELLQLLLHCFSSIEPLEQFALYEVCPGQEYQRKLHPDDIPLRAQAERLQRGESCHFLVRRTTPNYARRQQLLSRLTGSESLRANDDDDDDVKVGHDDCVDDGVDVDDSHSMMDLSIESLSGDLHSLLASDEDEDGSISYAPSSASSSSSGSSDTSMECSSSRLVRRPTMINICAKCRHKTAGSSNSNNNSSIGNSKSCEFCKRNTTLMLGKLTTAATANGAAMPMPATSVVSLTATLGKPVPTALPVTTCSSTPALSSTAAVNYNPVYNVREIRTATHSFSSLGKDKKLLDIQLNAHYDIAACRLQRPQSLYGGSKSKPTAAAAAAGTPPFKGEVVNNNPAKGLGHFVYL